MALAATMFGTPPTDVPDLTGGGGLPFGTSPSDLPTEPAVPPGVAAAQGSGASQAANASVLRGPDPAQFVGLGGTPGALPNQAATVAAEGSGPATGSRPAGLPGATTWPNATSDDPPELLEPIAPAAAAPAAAAPAGNPRDASGAPVHDRSWGSDAAVPIVPFVTPDGGDPLIVSGLFDPPAPARSARSGDRQRSNPPVSAPAAIAAGRPFDGSMTDLYVVREATWTDDPLRFASPASASPDPARPPALATEANIPEPATGVMAPDGPDPLVLTGGLPEPGGAPDRRGIPVPDHHAAPPLSGVSPAAIPAAGSPTDVASSRAEFPALQQRVNGRPLVWLDNAATTQKPQVVIDAVRDYYERDNSNIHRSAHALAARSSAAYEEARIRVARFLGAESDTEIVFTRGATEAINLLANTWGRANLGRGDEVLISHLEHHSNIVPWQMLCRQTGAILRVIPVDDRGDLDFAAFTSLLGPRTKLLAITQVSNALGTVVPVTPLVQLAHANGTRVLVDGAQAVAHLPVCVGPAGIDFYAFSGHKIFAPTGIGVLYGRRELLDAMPPWQGGGSMITDVTFERTVYAEPPAKFEAGTPHISGAIGLGVALDWLESRGRAAVAAYEHQLMEYASEALSSVPGVHLVGAPAMRAGALPFVMDGYRPADVARHLDQQGIAVRAGHHCAQPILRRFGHETVVRPSFAVYNTPADVDALTAALRMLGRRQN